MTTKTINIKTEPTSTVNVTVEGENVTIAITKSDSDASDTSGVKLETAGGKSISDWMPGNPVSLQHMYNESEQAKKALFRFNDLKVHLYQTRKLPLVLRLCQQSTH